MSLAYPVREYIAERKYIAELEVQKAQIAKQLNHLKTERRHLSDPAYIEQLARDRLHMCLPNQMCYVVIDPAVRSTASATPKRVADPWYAKLWSSVQLADGQPAHHPHSASRHVAASRPAARGVALVD
jgi:hypothetical protein